MTFSHQWWTNFTSVDLNEWYWDQSTIVMESLSSVMSSIKLKFMVKTWEKPQLVLTFKKLQGTTTTVKSYLATVTPRKTGREGTNKFHLLLADFRYCQYRKLKEMSWRDQGLVFIIGGFPLLFGPVLRGLTVCDISDAVWKPAKRCAIHFSWKQFSFHVHASFLRQNLRRRLAFSMLHCYLVSLSVFHLLLRCPSTHA